MSWLLSLLSVNQLSIVPGKTASAPSPCISRYRLRYKASHCAIPYTLLFGTKPTTTSGILQ
jgi:hypothetical protein